MSNKKLVILSSPSVGGKTTLASMLLEKHPQCVKLAISYTTRSPRGDEQNGIHYFFVDENQFKDMVSHGEFLEYALVFGRHWYGTSKEFVEKALDQEKNVLFNIDVQGANKLKESYGE